jgi:Tfp pilus assembly PilM family ATPase/Tfp pilus assembly protein PilN
MRTVGLELGGRELRAVVGEHRRGRWQLLEAAVEPLPDEPAARRAALSSFVERLGRSAQIIVGVPLSECSVRLVSFPPTGAENLARLARVEAESHFALPAEGLDFGWAVVESAGGQTEVAVAVCRRERLAQLLAPLREAGLSPQQVGVSAIALANLYGPEARRRGQALAVLQLADGVGELVLLDAAGGLRLVRAVPGETVALGQEVRRSLQAFGATGGPAVTRLLLCGAEGCVNHVGLAEAVGVPVELADPWAALGAALPVAEQTTPYSVATGLMLQGAEVALPVDLARREPTAGERQARSRSTVSWVLAGLLALVIVAGGCFLGAARQRAVEAAALAARVTRLQKQLEQVGGETPEFLALLAATRDRVRTESAWLDVLRQMAQRLPGEVSIEEWTCDRERGMTLRGQARSVTTVALALQVLNELARFDGARLESCDQITVGKETLYNFLITCPPPPAKGAKRAAGGAS